MRSRRLLTSLACTLALSGSAARAEGPVLEIQKVGLGPGLPYEMNWGIDPALPGYLVYDVIEGDLPTLLAAPAGDFTMAVTACLLEDGPLPPPALPLAPPVLGGQSFFLVRAQALPAVCGIGSWNEAFAPPASQVGDRDVEIPLDLASCPCP